MSAQGPSTRIKIGANIASWLGEISKENGCQTLAEAVGMLVREHRSHRQPWSVWVPDRTTEGPQTDHVRTTGRNLPNVSNTTTSLLLPSESLESKPSTVTPCGELEFFSPTIIDIPSNRSGVEVPITEAQATEFERLYPAVDVRQELKAMRAWSISNPKNRKTKAGMLRFVNGWLSDKQNRGTNGTRIEPKPSATDRHLAGIASLIADGRRR